MDSTSPLRIGLVDLWQHKEPCEDYLSAWAEQHGAVWDNEAPDILFYACGGEEHITHPAAVKVCWVQENLFPNFNVCDYAISHVRDSIGGRNLYYPYAMESLRERIELPPISPIAARRPFGIFIASQAHMGQGAILRKTFTEQLMQRYKQVDCPGKVLHNVDIPELVDRFCADWNKSKREVISRYKFLITFENTNTDGYITEKLVDAFAANTVPIYWGSEGNLAPFPKEAVICANDYPNLDSLIARIREVDENEELYLSILRANPLRQASFWELIEERHTGLRQFLDQIYSTTVEYKQGLRIKPDRGMVEFELAGNAVRILNKLERKHTPFRDWWRGLFRLHFARPQKPAPYRSLFLPHGRKHDERADR